MRGVHLHCAFGAIATFARILAVCVAALPASALAQKDQSRPNIIFVLSDDHRYDCIGATGNPNIRTPNLDQLARDGVNFVQAVAHVPQCSPNRAVILTGLPPHKTGWLSNQTQWKEVHDRNGFRNLPTVTGLLKDRGYRTVLIGKWHLAPDPWNCGFTDVRTWLPQGAGKYKDLAMGYGNDRATSPTRGFAQDVLGDDAAAYIRQRSATDDPFFMWVALTAPHGPTRPNP